MAGRSSTIEVAPPTACCPSVLAAPLGATDAAELAKGFAALSDPVRLRVLSMLAVAADDEATIDT